MQNKNHSIVLFMDSIPQHRAERRAKEHSATRTAILGAARTVAERDGAREFSLRGVAAEAGFAPAALYGYFRNKDELLVALASDDLSALSRAMRDAELEGLGAAVSAALRSSARDGDHRGGLFRAAL